MRTRILDLDELSPADLAAWHRLADRAIGPNAFLDPRFLSTVRAAFPESRDLRLAVLDDDGDWRALLGVTTKRVHPRIPWHSTTTGGDFMTSHADRHHPLLDPERPDAALSALLHGLHGAGMPGLLQLQHLPAEGAVAAALRESGLPTVERRRDRAPIALRDTVLRHAPEDGALPLLLGHLTLDDARNVRRRLRGIARELGTPARIDLLGDDPALDDEFVALQHAGWKGLASGGGASLRLHPHREEWFRRVTAAFRADGDLVGVRLTAGDHTLWIGYLMRSGGSYFGLLDAYDEQHRRFSPGAIGRLAALTHVFTQTDAPLFDPGFDERYTVGARLFPDRRAQVDVLVATGGALPRAVVAGWPAGVRVGAWAARGRGRFRTAVTLAEQTVRGSASEGLRSVTGEGAERTA